MYQTYRDKAVRDLAWVLDPHQDLLRSLAPFSRFDCFTPSQALTDWLDHLHCDPEHLHDWLKQSKSSRLGVYFESLVAFFLQHRPGGGPRLWRRGLPVRTRDVQVQGVRTLGELDFLLFDTPSLTHLEVAVKFYLSYDGQWLGPNARDTWDRKRRHMAHHQLPLSRMVAPALAPLAIMKQQFWVKGHLFRHWLRPEIWPEDCFDNKPCRWAHAHEVHALLAGSPGPWVALERSEWLGAAGPDGSDRALQPQALIRAVSDRFVQNPRGLMLSCGKPECPDCERLFIVADHWPAAPLESARPSPGF